MQKNWRELIKPKKLEVDKDTFTATYGKFILEPLERGFGITIGNSLRRILMSSLRGAAVTNVRIEGVSHEFSTIPGVKEDVSDIILALKQVKLIIEGEDMVKTLRLKVEGPADVAAGDIKTDSMVRVLNPKLHIATVAKGSVFNIELTAGVDKGYVSAERNKTPDMPVGVIPVDSVFNPVTRVNYEVTHARVGQRTDYDRLVFEVWTTGAIDPQTAVGIASKILQDQLSVLINFEDKPSEAETLQEKKPGFGDSLFKLVDELELSVRSANCLKNADIKYIGEMIQKSEHEMLRTKNFGRKSLNEIKALLHTMGLDFGMKFDGFPTRQALARMHIEHKASV
ncbi:MAG: DNA-directed RNA polymerase subunit alpha [Deltaproteobacteria bacterium]|nr:DNA-directed RNA polymerase subunit alpha [Deltaproteobacteria bacterium]